MSPAYIRALEKVHYYVLYRRDGKRLVGGVLDFKRHCVGEPRGDLRGVLKGVRCSELAD